MSSSVLSVVRAQLLHLLDNDLNFGHDDLSIQLDVAVEMAAALHPDYSVQINALADDLLCSELGVCYG